MPKKKAPEFPEEQKEKEEKYEEVWDLKKIIIGIIVIAILLSVGLIAKRIFFHESLSPSSFVPHVSFPSVRGISSVPNDTTQISHMKFSLPKPQEVQSQIQNIQTEITHLNLKEIASSTPQVKAVLDQIQNLPNEGTSQVKAACMRLCDNL